MKIFITLLTALLLFTTRPSEPEACINATYLEGKRAVRQLARARKLINQDKPGEALPLLNRHSYNYPDRLEDEARLLFKTAQLRLAAGRDEEYTYNNFASLVEKEPGNPVFLARRAEELLLHKDGLSKAHDLLEDLLERDLMPDSFAYQSLARARQRLGDKEGAQKALATCKKMRRGKLAKTGCSIEAKPIKPQPSKRKSVRRLRSKAPRSVLGGSGNPFVELK